MMRLGVTFEAFDVVVPFPFTDRDTTKRRPALAISNALFLISSMISLFWLNALMLINAHYQSNLNLLTLYIATIWQKLVYLMNLSEVQYKPLLVSDRNESLPSLVNLGTGVDVMVKELAELVSSVVGYNGTLSYMQSLG